MAGRGSLLLQLPDSCLLVVLQLTAAADQRSLFSAARAHSRLKQVAEVALRSISATFTEKEQLASIQLYLEQHSQHVDSLTLQGVKLVYDRLIFYEDLLRSSLQLLQLPQGLHLSSLQLLELKVQLQPGGGFRGVLGAAATHSLKQLQLTKCKLLDGQAGLAAALAQLPGLKHLSVVKPRWPGSRQHEDDSSDNSEDDEQQQQQEVTDDITPSPTLASALRHLQHLTALEFRQIPRLGRPLGQSKPLLQHMRVLTGLLDLRLSQPGDNCNVITASMLSGAQQLTRLQVSDYKLETAALASKTQLQHLALQGCEMTPGKEGMAQLLSHVDSMRLLTHLNLESSLYTEHEWDPEEDVSLFMEAAKKQAPFTAAFAALTASSRVQHLDISCNYMPPGVWAHMFVEGRPLPHLRVLNLGHLRNFPLKRMSHLYTQPKDLPRLHATRLVSCCPSLQELDLMDWVYYPELLAPLQGLSSLTRLVTGALSHNAKAFEAVVCHLTGLRDLTLWVPNYKAPGDNHIHSRQLTQLWQLTRLSYKHSGGEVNLTQGPGQQPVWHQFVQQQLDRILRDEVARQDIAAVRTVLAAAQ